jgi:hypothetical protein
MATPSVRSARQRSAKSAGAASRARSAGDSGCRYRARRRRSLAPRAPLLKASSTSSPARRTAPLSGTGARLALRSARAEHGLLPLGGCVLMTVSEDCPGGQSSAGPRLANVRCAVPEASRSAGPRWEELPVTTGGRTDPRTARQPRDEGRHVHATPPSCDRGRHGHARHRCSHGRREPHHRAPRRARSRRPRPHRPPRTPWSRRPPRRRRHPARWPRRLQPGPQRAARPVRRPGPVGTGTGAGACGTGARRTGPVGTGTGGSATRSNRLVDHPPTSLPPFPRPPFPLPPVPWPPGPGPPRRPPSQPPSPAAVVGGCRQREGTASSPRSYRCSRIRAPHVGQRAAAPGVTAAGLMLFVRRSPGTAWPRRLCDSGARSSRGR